MLLERAAIGVPQALERMGTLQAQYAPSMYIGLWSRVEGLEREAVTRALHDRTAVQATLMRATIHLASARDYWPLELAVRDARRAWWLRVTRNAAAAAEFEQAARELRARIASGPMRAKEIEALLGRERARGVGMWLDLVRVPPSGTWERRRADVYAAAEDWLGPAEVTPEQGLELAVRRYLGGYGPGTAAEIANWAGLPPAALAPALEQLDLLRLRGEEGQELLDLPDAPRPDPATPAPVRFLPWWDATLLAHARRTQILREEHRPLVFNTKMPQSVGTILVDGAVAATWTMKGGRIGVEPFDALPARLRRDVDAEAERLEAFVA